MFPSSIAGKFTVLISVQYEKVNNSSNAGITFQEQNLMRVPIVPLEKEGPDNCRNPMYVCTYMKPGCIYLKLQAAQKSGFGTNYE